VAACGEGIIKAPAGGRALLRFDATGCTFCGDCLEVCPLPGDDAPSRIGSALLARAKCVAWEGVVCMSCRLACGAGAIRMDARSRPRVDAAACTGCGICVAPCPTSAIEVRGLVGGVAARRRA